MALSEGVCRLGTWSVRVVWEGDVIHAVEFCDLPPAGEVPAPIAAYCRGEPVDLSLLRSMALERPGKSAAIYREVCAVPYGMTTTYGTDRPARRNLGPSRGPGHAPQPDAARGPVPPRDRRRRLDSRLLRHRSRSRSTCSRWSGDEALSGPPRNSREP